MSLYMDLGGAPAVEMALDRFYSRVMEDPRVSRYFDGIPIDRLKEKQRAFLAMVFGGPNEYEGRDLRSAHSRPRLRGLDEDGFEVFMGHFQATLEELGVDADQIELVMSIAYSGKDDVLDR